ncbi:MAG: hypothetical protein ACLPW4_14020 [Candidatus Sulfotelmatobacter sp.]
MHQKSSESPFTRIKTTSYLFVAALVFSVLAHAIKQIPGWVSELSLSLLAAITVHLIDRLFVYRELEDSLNNIIEATTARQASSLDASLEGLKQDFQLAVAERTADLAAKTTALTNQSLEKIERGIEGTIARQMGSLDAMARSGIERIYPGRREAGDDLYRDLIRKDTNEIRIIGISLNDFGHAQQPGLAEAWEAIRGYVLRGRATTGARRHLDIKVLIIDPNCFGATLRSRAELRKGHVLPGRLEDDVRDIANMMYELEKVANENGEKTGVTFECRLYRLPPMLFLFLVDSACYVEQYHFWSERKAGTPVPVVKYRKTEEESDVYQMHEEMRGHFDWIWKHGSISLPEFLEEVAVGVEASMHKASALNVYTEPGLTLERMLYLLNHAEKEVAIQGVSLRSFCQTGELWLALRKLIEDGRVKIRMLFIDPNCEQAKFRAYREVRLQRQGVQWKQYETHAQLHRTSGLYGDTDRAIRTLAREVKVVAADPPRPDWKLNLEAARYTSAPHCFLLRVDGSVLVEQYHYGKILASGLRAAAILGKDMPVVEFINQQPDADLYPEKSRREPFRLLEDHFSFAWELAEKLDLLALADEDYQAEKGA